MKQVLVVLLLAAVALAGCTGDGDGDGTGGDPTVGAGGSDGSGTEAKEQLRRLATTASNDTITFTEAGATPETLNCVQPCEYVYYSLFDRMEPDTAYFLEARLTWTWENQYQGSPSMILVGDAGIRDYGEPESDLDEATIDLTATVLAQADMELALRIGGGLQPPDHTVDVTLTPVTDAIPQYAPAAVTVPAGASLVVETQSGSGRVAIFDGDDALVNVTAINAPKGNSAGNKVFGTVAVTDVQEDTEFVVFTMDDIWAKLYVLQDGEAEAPVLRHLALAPGYTDIGSIDAGGDQTLTFTLEEDVLNVGYRYGNPDCNVPSNTGDCYTASQVEHRMLDPEGREILSGSVGFICYCGGYNTFSIAYDDMPHLLGDYTIEWTSEESSNVQVQGVTWDYVR